MALNAEKVLADLKALAKPELEKRAEELKEKFLQQIDDFVDSSRLDKLDDLLKKAAFYEVQAITESDRSRAEQLAEASEDVLRQIKLLLIAERIVASKEVAAMIEEAAISAWGAFRSVAVSVLGIAVKAAISGLLGPAGGAIADAAGSFLDDAIGGSDSDDSND